MLSVRAIYDGHELKLREKVNVNGPKEVIITFLDPLDDDIQSNEIHEMIKEGVALDFLNDEREDIYSDGDLKVKFN
ncbi:MAG TPA: hypothetical protein VK186_01000 [Candidatus Deferrimicrobium sp.]|nr:hypothetical protein [Candidatus Kapabacteria bacterium]HLP57369.1 hypothetical protein [Candidatus Deferrimicrobium sp.]